MTIGDSNGALGSQPVIRRVRRALTCAAVVAALLGPFGFNVAKADEAMIENCLKAAADLHHIPAGLLVFLINVESGRLGAVSQNSNGTVDIGPMQVNDSWVPKIARHWRASTEASYRALRDSFCANVEGGAWILRQALDEARGSLWEGVALYHSHAPIHKLEYMRLVYAQAMRLKREAVRGAAIADAMPLEAH
jgi:soluble lytic murein transglycosylase-like protein